MPDIGQRKRIGPLQSITGQEVLSSDGVTLKVSLAANYEIEDPDVAVSKIQNFQTAIHLHTILLDVSDPIDRVRECRAHTQELRDHQCQYNPHTPTS
jgi:hypothetical protein